MGLLIENTGEIKRLIDEISQICEISILNYEVTDRLLDGTVFYITFANEMREILSLSQGADQRRTHSGQPPHAAARRAGQAGRLRRSTTSAASPSSWSSIAARPSTPQVSAVRLADGLMLTAIEPPCGSNTYVLEYHGELFVRGLRLCLL